MLTIPICRVRQPFQKAVFGAQTTDNQVCLEQRWKDFRQDITRYTGCHKNAMMVSVVGVRDDINHKVFQKKSRKE